jgi:hypothetical protein
MIYADFLKLSREEAQDTLASMSEDDIGYLRDQRPYTLPAFQLQQDHYYFDDIDEMHMYLRGKVVPSTKPWQADQIVSHELAHGECALALGVAGVKFSVTTGMDVLSGNQVFTHIYGPVTLPILALAAIASYPYDSERSVTDMSNLRHAQYTSRPEVFHRIIRWNETNSELHIPIPLSDKLEYPH